MSDLTLVIGSRNLSSWSLRPWLVLRHVGVPFREVVIALDQPNTHARIRALSPAAKVPLLLDGDLTVWDSLAITEYLAERFPQAGVWPVDRRQRAEARSLCAEMHAGFAALRAQLPMAFCHTRPMPPADEDLAADIERIVAIWSGLRDRHAAAGDFLFGAFSAADAFFAPVVSRFRSYGVPVRGAAAAYAETVWRLPAMQDWLAGAIAER
jgi:glutathione S-transferase